MKHYLRLLLIGAISGFIAGTIALGIIGRLSMRMIAVLAGSGGNFSWDGTLEVVLLGTIIGTIAGTLYGGLAKYRRGHPILMGLLYGGLVFLAVLIIPIEGKGAARGFPQLHLQVYLLFAGIFILFGIALAYLFPWIGAWLDKRNAGENN